MKHVLIAIPFILFASLITTKTSAQHAGIFVHALYAAPVGGISSDFYDGGAGVEGGILAGRKNTRFVGSIGYSHFFKDNSNSYENDFTASGRFVQNAPDLEAARCARAASSSPSPPS